MDESQSFFSKPALPPKRKPAIGSHIDVDSAILPSEESISEEAAQQDNFLPEENEIDPEILAAYAQAMKETGSEVIIDIPVKPQEYTVTAPILEDYIDPHAVPIQYLLEQARATVKPNQVLPQDSLDFAPDEPEENE